METREAMNDEDTHNAVLAGIRHDEYQSSVGRVLHATDLWVNVGDVTYILW